MEDHNEDTPRRSDRVNFRIPGVRYPDSDRTSALGQDPTLSTQQAQLYPPLPSLGSQEWQLHVASPIGRGRPGQSHIPHQLNPSGGMVHPEPTTDNEQSDGEEKEISGVSEEDEEENATGNGGEDDRVSVRSKGSVLSNASQVRREAELELEQAQALAAAQEDYDRQALEIAKQKLLRDQKIAMKKLAVSKAKLEEEYEDLFSDVESVLDGQSKTNSKEQKKPDSKIFIGTGGSRKTFPPKKNDKRSGHSEAPEKTIGDLARLISKLRVHENPHGEKMNKFFARQTMGKELPPFAGDPEEWPAFIEEFERTTDICEFSNDENLVRLRKSLKEKAKEAVQALMVAPQNVAEIIETLRLNFGKPAYIIESLISKARKTPAPKEGRLETILPFSNAVRNLAVTTETLGKPEYLKNPALVRELVDKLPDQLRLAWATEMVYLERVLKRSADLKDFSKWIVRQAETIAEICIPRIPTQAEKGQREIKENRNKLKNKESVYSAEEVLERRDSRKAGTTYSMEKPNTRTTRACYYCSKTNHGIEFCFKFAKLKAEERLNWVKGKQLCFSCLRAGHGSKFCKLKKRCDVDGCDRMHHKLLHFDEGISNNGEVEVVSHASHPMERRKVLLRVIPVVVSGPKGSVSTFAFMDDGATCSMIETKLAKAIGVHGPVKPLEMIGIYGKKSIHRKSKIVSFKLNGDDPKKVFTMQKVKTVKELGIPGQSVDIELLAAKWAHVKEVGLDNLRNAKPTILIGQDHIDLIIAREVREGPRNAPVLSRTKLGWVIHGNISAFKGRVDKDFSFFAYNGEKDNTLHNLVKDSFTTESFGVQIPKKPLQSRENERAQELMMKSTKRIGNRFQTGLLWKADEVIMPSSREMAYKRLLNAERKMDMDQEFAKWYPEVVAGYVNKGYARYLSEEEAAVETPRTWYLPHFGVKNPNKPGNIRFVFDAAAKSEGISLNDNLIQGPDILNSLVGTLFKFRQKKIAFGGDMKDFFHQVEIKPEDQHAQRFLFRGMDRNREPDVLVMRVLIFGATSSPYSANYVKNKNAEDWAEEFPEASKAILNRHYVDDYLDSADTVEEALDLINSVTEVHKRGGFEIGKWTSSSEDVLKQILEEARSTDLQVLESAEPVYERTLGLLWDPKTDSFKFNTKFPKVPANVVKGDTRPTKREVLKLVMSVFDPLGFLAHFVIQAKILLQEIWRAGIGWDDQLPDDLHDKFLRWVAELPNVAKISIGRCYSLSRRFDSESIQLHVFCDAGEKAFACAAYIRIAREDIVDSSLVMARTRVAPLKPMSIPRLELQAAVMASRLAATIKDEHEIEFEETHFWSDSRTVLCWLRSDARNYKTFVGHRIGEILETTEVNQWHWVPTSLNVADDATRDKYPPNFSKENRWWTGPDFLKMSKEEWPRENFQTNEEIDDGSELKKVLIFAAIEIDVKSEVLPQIERFSSWIRLIRTTARVLKFIKLVRKKTGNDETVVRGLTTEDMAEAEKLWWKQAQRECFPEEIADLQKEKWISKKSRIYKLSPFSDEEGILRIQGRTMAAENVGGWVKQPVILDTKHPFSRLLIDYHHKLSGHHGMERVFNELRQKYWILNMRQAIKSSWSRCQHCKNIRAKPKIPEMGDLPECRMKPFIRPFTYTGMDYFGPMEVTIGRRHEKRYGVLFTCMTTRAVHLEIAASLTTGSCIMAIRRMAGRRGPPLEMYSDNGTNLRGADRELKEALEDLDCAKIKNELSPKGINWHFIPPSAPQ